MLEGGKFIIKKDGLRLDQLRTVNSVTRESTILNKDEVRHFTHATFIGDRDSKLWLSATGNGVEASVSDMATVTMPESHFSIPSFERWQTANFTAGNIPGDKTIMAFGEPETAIEVHYLGHPLREEMTRLMAGDKPSTDDVFFEDNERIGKHLLNGAAVPVLITGFEEPDNIIFGDTREPHAYMGKSGEVMLGAYLETIKKDSEKQSIEVFAATKSQEDGLIRVHETKQYVSLRYSEDGGASRVIDELAAVSVFGNSLANQEYEVLHADFPLPFVDYVMKDLSARNSTGQPGAWYGHLYRNYGFDWEGIREDLPQEQVQSERERLTDVLQVVYEAPYPKKTATSKKRKYIGGGASI